MHNEHRNLHTYIRMSIGLFSTEIYANWVRKENFRGGLGIENNIDKLYNIQDTYRLTIGILQNIANLLYASTSGGRFLA